jgi:hypothetical protein
MKIMALYFSVFTSILVFDLSFLSKAANETRRSPASLF